MSYPPVPAPTPVLIHVLSNLPALADDTGERVSTVLDVTLPALRVASVGHQGSPSDWEAAPMFQIEVWDHDELEAERIAWALKAAWPSATPEIVGDATVHGRWIVQDPYPLPPNDRQAKDTDLARYLLMVAFRLTGVIPHG